MNYRNRALLDLAHHLPCQHCGAVEASEPAHSNWSRHGKGMSLKAHDVYFAAMCHSCHAELDQGSRWTREQREEIWRTAHEKTLLELWTRGWLKVIR